MKTMIDKISERLVFYDLQDEYKQILAENAELKYYPVFDVIFNKGEPASYFYIITRGEIQLLEDLSGKGSVLPGHTIKEGEIVGWSWLMPPYLWNYHGLATSDVELIQIDAEAIKVRIESDHQFGYEIYKRLYYTVVDRLFTTRCFILENQALV